MQDQDLGMSRRTAFGASAAIVLAAGASA